MTKASPEQSARMVALLRPEVLRVEVELAQIGLAPARRADLELRRANLRARIRQLDEDALGPAPLSPEAVARAAVKASAARRKQRRERLRAALDDLDGPVPVPAGTGRRG